MNEVRLTKRNRHLATIKSEHVIPENIRVRCYDKQDKHGNPEVPFAQGQCISAILKTLEGLYVHGGDVFFRNQLEQAFQEFEHGEGFTGYILVWVKMRYKGPKYVTIVAWDKGTELLPLCSHDSEEIDWTNEVLPKPLVEILKILVEIIVSVPLPDPPITYQMI